MSLFGRRRALRDCGVEQVGEFMCSGCGGNYENPDADREDLEFSDYGRDASGIAKAGVWAAVIGIGAAIWVAVIVRLYPLIHRLLQ